MIMHWKSSPYVITCTQKLHKCTIMIEETFQISFWAIYQSVCEVNWSSCTDSRDWNQPVHISIPKETWKKEWLRSEKKKLIVNKANFFVPKVSLNTWNGLLLHGIVLHTMDKIDYPKKITIIGKNFLSVQYQDYIEWYHF